MMWRKKSLKITKPHGRPDSFAMENLYVGQLSVSHLIMQLKQVVIGFLTFLVSKLHLLLPAHCIHDVGFPRVYAKDCHFVLGLTKLDKKQTESSNIIRVEKFIPHPEYDAYSEEKSANIAIALLGEKISEMPICLDDSKSEVNDIGIVTGWTETENLDEFEIEQTSVKILESKEEEISIQSSASDGNKCIGKRSLNIREDLSMNSLHLQMILEEPSLRVMDWKII